MKRIHILLVEDNEGDILLTREALEEANLLTTLSVTKDGKEAIDFLNKHRGYPHEGLPDLVLLDINLPKKNGQEVLKYIKGHENLKRIPVFMLTTSCSEKDMNQAYTNHASCYLTKPVEANDFLSMVATIENLRVAVARHPAIKPYK